MWLDQPLPDVKPLSHSLDGFLDGRLTVKQPKRGFRAGLDSVLLGASVTGTGGRLLDLGAGAGVAGLVAMSNNPELKVVFADNDAELVGLCKRNIEANGFSGRAQVVLANAVSGEGIEERGFDIVIANPPFYDPARHTVSAQAPTAHAQSDELIDAWVATAARALKKGGEAMFVHHAKSLDRLREAFAARFAGVTVQPLAPHGEAAPIRVMLWGTATGAGAVMLPPVEVHSRKGGPFSASVEDALRGRAAFHWNAPDPMPR